MPFGDRTTNAPIKLVSVIKPKGDLLTESPEFLSLANIVGTLRAAGSVFAEEEANLLLSEADSPEALAKMIEQRVCGIPIEHILGWAEFRGLRVTIEPDVFIPRYRTEFLASQAIAFCNPNSVVLDLCCGTGAIGLSVISSIPTVQLFASDIDPTAVRCAIQNLAQFNVPVFEGDLFEPIPENLKGRIEVLVANGPYVPTEEIAMMPREARLYETQQSLDGGRDGLDIHRRIASEAAVWLAPGGVLLIETSEGQADQAAEVFLSNGLDPRIEHSDEFDTTIVIATRLA